MKNCGRKMKQNKGITLNAMVVTIIVLIILAGISISYLLGKNSIMEKAEEQKVIQEVAQITERLELKKVDVALDKNKGNVPIDEYIKEVENNEDMLYKVTEVNKVDEEKQIQLCVLHKQPSLQHSSCTL
jgi:Tfp pilus assembly protein PilE